MKALSGLLLVTLCVSTACNRTSAPTTAKSSTAPDAVSAKLQGYAGGSATDCGRLNMQATADQAKAASECAVQASQGKKPFYVAYDMPGMALGVAGNSDGKLFTVQSQNGSVTGGECPAQLRVASSGRVTCFAPGDMGSMSGSHAAGSVPSGMENPHGGASKPPSN